MDFDEDVDQNNDQGEEGGEGGPNFDDLFGGDVAADVRYNIFILNCEGR